MSFLKKLSWWQAIGLILIPVAAFAISWSMNGFSAPAAFRNAAQALGLRVTQVCRSNNARYGATRSLHKRCLAMDVSQSTPRSTIDRLRQFGLCAQWHPKGYFGATGDHWHVVQCSTASSRDSARRDQRGRADNIRKRNKKRRSSTRQIYYDEGSPRGIR